MQVLQCISLSDMQPAKPPKSCVICLGNFDGVHFAHRALMKRAKLLRDELFPHAACGAFCFQEPSSDYLSAATPAHLCTLKQKLRYFHETGLEYAFLANFPAIKELSPAEFANEILLNGCHCVAAVCGFNYRFGKGGKGTPKMLSELLERPVSVEKEIQIGGKAVSSTRIRGLLSEGDAETAHKLLCRPYCFTSPVVHGKALGQKLGTPTVNQYFPEKMIIPRHGVYVTSCEVNGKNYCGVSNVGVHPTVDAEACVNCETYLLNFEGNLYGKEITVSFLKFLREEQKFSGVDELRAQIQKDIEHAAQFYETEVLQ